MPASESWQELISECEYTNTLVLATTQCPNGKIELGQYESSKILKNTIVTDGKDITSEAALTKLMWVIGNFNVPERRAMLSLNLRGEIT